MRPDRFGQSTGKDFIESKGRERDGPFRDIAALSKIDAYCAVFGFVPFSTILSQITSEILMFPEMLVYEEYFDGSTHEVLLSSTGDVVPDLADRFTHVTITELSGAYQSPPAVPLEYVSQTTMSQTTRLGGFCTATATIRGDGIPLRDFLHELYERHKPLSDFDDGSWQMVRNPTSHDLTLVHPGVASDTAAGNILAVRGNGRFYTTSHDPASRILACGALISSFSFEVSKTLMNVASAGFSDWINSRKILSTGASYQTLRCIHSVGVEVLQPAPIDMTDDWFITPPLGPFEGTTDSLNLLRWARPAITPPAPASQWVGALVQCNA